MAFASAVGPFSTIALSIPAADDRMSVGMPNRAAKKDLPSQHPPILLVDDEPQLLHSAKVVLRSWGLRGVLTLENSQKVLPLLAERDVAVLVLDLTMPKLSGQDLLEQIGSEYPHIPVIIMTATNDLDTAVKCMQMGAYDYLVKPVEGSRLVSSVMRAIENRVLKDENESLKESLLRDGIRHEDAFSEIVTQDKAMRAIFQYLEAIASSNQPVLVTGETGVGKELVARAVHKASGDRGEFVAVDIAGVDDSVLSDTLFGHKRGAFTGADRPREGLIAKAAGGTLFLDEIGDMKPASQVKLLRLLQERKYYPLGSDTPRDSDARIVMATHWDISQRIGEGLFRKDLYYRLRAHHVHIPALRERKADLPLLLDHFLDKASRHLNKKKPTLPFEIYGLLNNYHFPGNVRELESMVFDTMARHQRGVLSLKRFKEMIGQERAIAETEPPIETYLDSLNKVFPETLPTLREAEHLLIAEALRRAEGNQGIAASTLGITRQALNKRLVRNRSRLQGKSQK